MRLKIKFSGTLIFFFLLFIPVTLFVEKIRPYDVSLIKLDCTCNARMNKYLIIFILLLAEVT